MHYPEKLQTVWTDAAGMGHNSVYECVLKYAQIIAMHFL
jgi:hypothetical protein